jgi:release factor glutamine methyltransferase
VSSTPVIAVPVMTAVAEAARVLTEAGVASPRHDAEALAAYVLGVSRSGLRTASPEAFSLVRGPFEAGVARRAAREPLQHVVGTAPFRHLELAVGPGVLIPRPETELLIDAALSWLRESAVSNPRVADLGTGSGALALAMAGECPGAKVWAVERDPDAVEWAVRNIAAAGPGVQLVAADLAEALHELDGTLDVVLSNPPYLPLELRDQLEPEVRHHDPQAALFAGADALATVRLVEAASRRLLRPGGLVVVEHGDDQGQSAPACFGSGWAHVTDHLDLAGRPRYLTAVLT